MGTCGGYRLWDFRTSTMLELPTDLPYSGRITWSPDSRQVILEGAWEASSAGLGVESSILDIDTLQVIPVLPQLETSLFPLFLWIR
jgi:hypothetical protein